MKLLHRTRRPFWIYTVLVLALTVPACYLILERQWMADIDEDLLVQRQKVEAGLNGLALDPKELAITVERINALRSGVQLAPYHEGDPIGDVITTEHLHDAFHGHDEPFRTLHSRIMVQGRPYAIRVERVIEETEELVIAIALVMLVVLVLLLGGILLLDRMAATRIWAPFNRTLQGIKAFQVDSGDPFHAQPTGVTEFDELERAVEQLAERNTALYAEQKRFTENAAHEMRTPVALLQSKVDRLFQSPGLSEDQARLLEEANITIGRMRRLYDGLVLLARIDNDRAPAQGEVKPVDTVRGALATLAPVVEELNINVSIADQSTRPWSIAPSLAEVLFANLIGNAVNHNGRDGSIRIVITNTTMRVSNTGVGEALDPAILFHRFASSGKGLGLGLAIAERVCNRRGWTLQYAFEEGSHTFTVRTDQVAH